MSKKSASKSNGRGRRRSDSAHETAAPNRTAALTNGNGAGGAAELFKHLAQAASRLTGRPITFIVAVALIVVWAATGPVFNYSDTWQLIVNTATTIVTFLMVFLIQNTQNRDTLALQIKLADLIIAMRGADNRLAAAEDLSDDELEALHAEYRRRADATLSSLEERRSDRPNA